MRLCGGDAVKAGRGDIHRAQFFFLQGLGHSREREGAYVGHGILESSACSVGVNGNLPAGSASHCFARRLCRIRILLRRKAGSAGNEGSTAVYLAVARCKERSDGFENRYFKARML
ncbi:hypothetical protein Defa_00320 [Desulfovibrio sp. TH_2024_36128]|uniref:Uncharacterized protein n=1 Tax=Desulfovibrio falkowii TaxID=3136602 RepID=A0ABQ0E4A6_9BACT